MKKQTITLFILQLLASAIVMVADANTGSRCLANSKDESTDIRDLEIETNQEQDVFPDLITFALHVYQ